MNKNKKHTLWINYNGHFMSPEEFPFTLENRAFLYGDQMFESIKVINQKPCFVDLHLKRLYKAMDILNYSVNLNTLKKNIDKTIAKNKLKNGHIKIIISRKDGGKYTPTKNTSTYLVLPIHSKVNDYQYNKTGMSMALYSKIPKQYSPVSFFKSSQSFAYIMAGLSNNKHIDHVLILNEKIRLCEGSNSNVFLVRGHSLLTPPINEGCIDGIMRQVLINIAPQLHLTIEEIPLTKNDLLLADEVFFCNSQFGIQWIKSYLKKSYSNNISKLLYQHLSRIR